MPRDDREHSKRHGDTDPCCGALTHPHIRRAGCHRVFARLTDHGGALDVALLAERVAGPSL
jgi:hypothetical protein